MSIFRKQAYEILIDHEPTHTELKKMKDSEKSVYISGGWQPGWSTDYDSVALAQTFELSRGMLTLSMTKTLTNIQMQNRFQRSRGANIENLFQKNGLRDFLLRLILQLQKQHKSLASQLKF